MPKKVNYIERFRKFLNEMEGSDEFLAFSERNYAIDREPTTISNPASLWKKDGEMNEGLVRTYPLNDTVRYVKEFLRLEDWQVISGKDKSGIDAIVVLMPEFFANRQVVDKSLDACGYYPIAEKGISVGGKDFSAVEYRPKFQDKSDDGKIRSEEKFLYHVTPSRNKEKILRNGFYPVSKNSEFNYPGRVHFVLGSASEEEIYGLARQLYEADKNKKKDGMYTIFKLDINRFPKRAMLFKDPSYCKGVYTYANIRPDVIIGSKEIEI